MFERPDKLYLEDIVQSSEAIIQYIDKMDFDQFCKDRKTMAATIRELEIIGEAVGKLSINLKEQYKSVDWRDIKDMRNILIHGYFGIDNEIIWKIIKQDIPVLLKTIYTIAGNQPED